MPEELAFARQASGLVRGLSLWDAFGIGLMVIQPIYAIWYAIQVGVGLFPGGNLLIALAISVVMCGLTAPVVWGILGASMPRSGGEYIYNSRILHPAIAMGASFANVLAITYWNIFIATWIASPSLAILAQYEGWTGLNTFVSSKFGVVVLATACNVAAFLSVAFGMNVFKRIQRPLIVIGIGGPLVLAAVLTFASKASFIHHWNAQAAKFHSLDYHAFVTATAAAAGSAMPKTWNWGDTIGLTSGVFYLFIYAYALVYLSGEVKRPDKTVFKASWLAILIPTVLGIWTFAGLYHLVDFNFLSAAAHNDLFGGTKGYNMPYSTSYMTLSWLASGSNWVIAVIAAGTFLLTSFWLVVVDLMLVPRAMFAWGMDRMGPKWFTDIHPRWATPLKLYALIAGVQIVLTIAYELWLSSQLTGLVAAGMQLVSVFLITGISGILFAYRKKVRGIWESSPYRNWKLFGIPLITIAAVVYVVYILVLLYFAFIDSKTRDLTGKKAILFAAAWAIGIAWYFFWKRRSAKVGVDISVTYGELPPE
jgi:amino acid transporter